MGKKRTKRSSRSSSRSNKRMRRSFIKKSRGRSRRSLRRMRGGVSGESGESEAGERFTISVGKDGTERWKDRLWSKVIERPEYYNIKNLNSIGEAWTEKGLGEIQRLIRDIYTSVGGDWNALPPSDKRPVYRLYKNTGLIHFNPEASEAVAAPIVFHNA